MSSVEKNTLPQGWRLKPLGELAKFSQGQQIGLRLQLNQPRQGLNRFIRIVDYTQGTDDKRYVEYNNPKHFANKDDIIMVLLAEV